MDSAVTKNGTRTVAEYLRSSIEKLEIYSSSNKIKVTASFGITELLGTDSGIKIALEKSKETGEPFAVLYFDLNHFKTVNDTMGHETGDELLKYVSARVASILRKPDLLARLGGDEFAALLHNCDAAGMEIVLERLLENVQRPLKVGEHTLVADLSIGTAFYPENGVNLPELLRCADSAMYYAKQQKRETILPNNEINISEIANNYAS